MPITLYSYPGGEMAAHLSPLSEKVARALTFKGVEFVVRTPDRPVRRLMPDPIMPVLDYEGDLIVGSTSILRFVEARTTQPPLVPDDERLAALARTFEDWADQSLLDLVLYLQWQPEENYLVLKELLERQGHRRLRRRLRRRLVRRYFRRRDPSHVRAELRRKLDDLELLVSEEPDEHFLAGAQLTHADLAVASMLGALRRGPTPAAGTLIEDRATLVDYLARVDAQTGLGQGEVA